MGAGSLIAAKFIPGISTVAPPMVGALGMSAGVFLAYDVLAANVWTGLFTGLGATLSEPFHKLLAALTGIGLRLGVVSAARIVVRRRWAARRSSSVLAR
jgi:membrane protein DedA with SNARE-associated domain